MQNLIGAGWPSTVLVGFSGSIKSSRDWYGAGHQGVLRCSSNVKGDDDITSISTSFALFAQFIKQLKVGINQTFLILA